MEPESGFVNPKMQRMAVVLPAHVGTEEANDPTAGNFEGGVVEGEQLSVLFRHAL
ncbi:MAG: hypothetical protein WBM50_17685 [Acidimicrobiales bacterium]